jgi:hypothetical protein
MKLKLLTLCIVMSLVLSLGFVKPVEAAGYGTSFLTSITYMNVGSQSAQVIIEFYAEGATSVTQTYPVADLAAGAAASLGMGSVFTGTFKGSAVISSTEKLVATLVQVPQGSTTVKNRPLSNGFSEGSTTVLIPTVLKAKFNTNSIFSVQNTGTAAANVDVEFIPATDGTAHTFTIQNLAVGAAKFFDMGTYTAAGTVFNGSVRITSAQPMVATSQEGSLVTDAVYAFEGINTAGSNTLFMPSALCRFGAILVTSAFAIQNTSTTTPTTVTVTFTGTASSVPVSKTVNLGTLQPGQKVSASGCGDAANALPTNFIGAATVNAPDAPVVAIAKIFNSGSFSTAHLGASGGVQKIAAPYVRYSDKFYSYINSPSVQQTNIAVQNVGSAQIAANQITVQFVGPDGSVKGTYTYPSALAVGAKFSVNPKLATPSLPEFGYVAGATGKPVSFGGGAIITGPTGSQLAAVVRVQTSTAAGDVAEDYNAIDVP